LTSKDKLILTGIFMPSTYNVTTYNVTTLAQRHRRAKEQRHKGIDQAQRDKGAKAQREIKKKQGTKAQRGKGK
jgi:hypothetical protein